MTQQNGFYLLKVPFKWKAIYNTLLRLMTKQGISIMEDCTSACSGKGKKLLACWIEFNVACASVEINQRSALILIQDVVNRLNTNYNTDFDLDYYSTLDFEEEPPKVLFGNCDFFEIDDNYNTFDEIMKENYFTTQEELTDYINRLLEDQIDIAAERLFRIVGGKHKYDFIYIDDDDDLLFNAELDNDVFLIKCPNGYRVNKVYYKFPLGESIIELVYSKNNLFIYFNRDKTNIKKLYVQLEKYE